MRETIKIGSKGEDVKFLQTVLGLKADGDFGKKAEEAVKKFQKEHGLTADGVVGRYTWVKIEAKVTMETPKVGEVGNGVTYNPIDKHITLCEGRKIKYLVIHYTAGATSKGESELSQRKTFLLREASADFVVDDDSMLQANPDPSRYYCWAVGDKGDGRKKTITNKDCISIEVCCNLKKGTSAAVPNHEGWYFTDETLKNLLKLTKILQKTYKIPNENVIRHFDVTGKMCPGIIGWNTGKIYDAKTGKVTSDKNNETEWFKFKSNL